MNIVYIHKIPKEEQKRINSYLKKGTVVLEGVAYIRDRKVKSKLIGEAYKLGIQRVQSK